MDLSGMVLDGIEHFGYKLFKKDIAIASLSYQRTRVVNEDEQIGMITLYINDGKYMCDDYQIVKKLLEFIHE